MGIKTIGQIADEWLKNRKDKEKILKKLEAIKKYKSFLFYYIFDYDPKNEIEIRKCIQEIEKKEKDIEIFDLYDIMIDLLEKEGCLEECMKMEKDDGMEYLARAVNDLLRMSDNNNYFVEYIEKNTDEKNIVFLTGIGKIKGMINISKIVNNLENVYLKQPLILFLPEKINRRKKIEDLDSKKLYRGILLEV